MIELGGCAICCYLSSKASGLKGLFTKEAYRSVENKISNPFDFDAIREVNKGFINKPLRPEAFEERQQQMAQPLGSIMPPPMPGAVPPPSPPPPQSLFNRGIEALRDIELDKLMGS